MEPGYPNCGSVSGRVTTENTSNGLACAYVAIVNAANVSQAHYEGHADENGYYIFLAANNTVTGGSVSPMYRVYASVPGTGDGVSNPFGVGDGATSAANVIIANAGRISSGFVVEHIPMPDDLRLSAQPDTIFTGGNVTMITAQLYLNGQLYERSGVTITFFSDNETVGYLPADKTAITGPDGKASVNLTTGNATGNVSITGYTHTGISRNLTGTCTVHILSPAEQEINVNNTGVQNASKALSANQTIENTTSGNSSANTLKVGASATPEPASATGNIGAYVLLVVLLVAVAGLGAYFLVFRKK
jgi:hypothetical protein